MTSEIKMNRRTYLTGQAVAVAAATVAAPAVACTKGQSAKSAGRVYWNNATAADLERFVGDRFKVASEDGSAAVLRLVAVEPVPFGSDAPASLPRSEGVIAVFDSPDKAPIVAGGHQTRRVRHPVLGSADLFLGPVRKRNGDDVLEITLT
ncbi:DUF6916 family protein [Phaeobacter marinintestinus]|uniref:DUF6916 family protein n=1 Tax=Falsiphaeobacter marinintestinus TaxID=1492905 RepID=UPI0011B5A37F|nr:hypothetical protein [Phaeobacter marinintestinus]